MSVRITLEMYVGQMQIKGHVEVAVLCWQFCVIGFNPLLGYQMPGIMMIKKINNIQALFIKRNCKWTPVSAGLPEREGDRAVALNVFKKRQHTMLI